jgi:preprotein translocase subunit SecG
MQQLILILHILVAIAIIALVLMQHGRGADVGASFGSGSSNTMFGSAGALPFLMKLTVACAVLFFITSISLTYLASRGEHKADAITMPAMPAMPAQPTTTKAAQPATTNDAAGLSFTPSAPVKQEDSKK